MNKRLDEALSKVRALSDEEQQAAADILLDYLEGTAAGTWLSPEQIVEIERRLDANDIASDEEVKAFFDRTTS
jgi:hypothetical protein